MQLTKKEYDVFILFYSDWTLLLEVLYYVRAEKKERGFKSLGFLQAHHEILKDEEEDRFDCHQLDARWDEKRKKK